MAMILGLLKPSKGKILIDGMNIEKNRIKLHEFKEYFGYQSDSQPYKVFKKFNIKYNRFYGVSRYEKEITEFLKEHYQGEIITNTRSIISPYELDIYIPEKNLAVEFNGMLWHSYGNKIYIPCPQVTCVCIGGKNLDVVFITTAKENWTSELDKKYPKRKLQDLIS